MLGATAVVVEEIETKIDSYNDRNNNDNILEVRQDLDIKRVQPRNIERDSWRTVNSDDYYYFYSITTKNK